MKHTPRYVDDPAQARRDMEAISGGTELALDTEGASFHRFVDRIYLMQLSTRDRTLIVDPLAVDAGALEPLGRMLEDARCEIVLHDADYDLRLMHSDYGWSVRNIFDTRIAAQLIGLKSFGLAALLERYFGVKLDKKHQRADWSMRPLTKDMLDYAAQDTQHLLELRDRLRDELESLGRMSWAREEFTRLEGTRWPDEDNGNAFLKVKGARDLSRRELAVMRELVNWRDALALKLDRATFRVIGNEQLLKIAEVQPTDRQTLGQIKGVSRPVLEMEWQAIVDAIRRGQAVPEADLPKFPKAPRWDRDPQFDTRVDALKSVRDAESQRLNIDPGVLASRERLEAVARKNPGSREEMEQVTELRDWQREVLGERFLRALKPLREK